MALGEDTPARSFYDSIIYPVLLSLFAGSATGLGGLLSVTSSTLPSPALISLTLCFAAGVMVTVSLFDLYLPTALESMYDCIFATFYFALGFLLILGMKHVNLPEAEALMQQFYRVVTPVYAAPKEAVTVDLEANSAVTTYDTSKHKMLHNTDTDGGNVHPTTSALRLGVLLCAILTAHNLPEGLAVGLGNISHKQSGIVLASAIFVHNVAEGFVVAVPIYAGTGSKTLAVMLTLLSGLSEPIGALIGVSLVGIVSPTLSASLLSSSLCAVAGIMAAVSTLDLIPQARMQNNNTTDLIRAFVAGCGMIGVTIVAL